jgi:hypothetical protein
VALVDDVKALYDRRAEVAEKAGAAGIEKALPDDKTYQTLVRSAVEHQKPGKPPEPAADATPAQKLEHAAAKAAYEVKEAAHNAAMKSYETQLAFVSAQAAALLGDAAVLSDKAAFEAMKTKTKDVLDKVREDSKRRTMAIVAVLPAIMAICYLGLILYFKAKGGYKAIDLMEGKA